MTHFFRSVLCASGTTKNLGLIISSFSPSIGTRRRRTLYSQQQTQLDSDTTMKLLHMESTTTSISVMTKTTLFMTAAASVCFSSAFVMPASPSRSPLSSASSSQPLSPAGPLSFTTTHSVLPQQISPSSSRSATRRSLYLDLNQKDDVNADNEWGIPSSQTLEPFSDTPLEALPNGGKVTLVGSGPGDPDLLTRKAYEILQDPNSLVICDRLVSAEIVALVQGECKVARKMPGCAEMAQEEIYWWAHQGLQAGKQVVRLKIGDPFVFGRGGEEVLTFRKWGLESHIVPGVSAAFAAPLLGNIPVTHRGVSNQVVMCTGYGREGTSPDLIQYHKEQTIVFLMAVGRLRDLCQRLITLAGYPEDTAVGIVEKAGCPEQRTLIGDMTTIADLAEEHQIQAPSTIVVGEVVNVLQETDKEGNVLQGILQDSKTIEL